MNVLLIGSGGREHALAWKISRSTLLERLYIAPGNPGTDEVGTNVELDTSNFEKVADFVREREVDVVVCGPEAPLVDGIHDHLVNSDGLDHITVIGPKKAGAMLEGSKAFAKSFMKRHQIPTARYQSFGKDELEKGYGFLEELNPPYVLKADGLAAGKGVLILNDLDKAKDALREMLVDEKFGSASEQVVIEEFLDGVELSIFIITDGESYKILPEAKDYKRIGEGDTGLNTGGMGAVSPVAFAREEFLEKVELQVIRPTLRGLREDGIDYRGFLFLGLMSVKGDPYVVEYNVRLGDPETQVVLPRLKSDLLDLFEGISTGTLSECHVERDERTAVSVVMVSGGYPGSYEKGKEISGISSVEDSIVFQAGTSRKNGQLQTSGGRVLAITSIGKDLEKALEKSYASAGKIRFEGAYYRKDIGYDLKSKQKA